MTARTSDDSPESSLDPVLDFMRLLWSIEHGLQAASKRMERRIGITGPQRLALRIVHQFPGISAGELARTLHLHPSTITGIVQRLVEKQYLHRERDRRDTRRVRLRSQARARKFLSPSTGTIESAVARVLKRAPTAQVRQARKVLADIARALE